MTCDDWMDDGKGGAYRQIRDVLALRVGLSAARAAAGETPLRGA